MGSSPLIVLIVILANNWFCEGWFISGILSIGIKLSNHSVFKDIENGNNY